MIDSDGLMTVEVTYQQVDRIGVVPQIGQAMPCDESPSGVLLVVEKTPIVRGSQRVGWTVKGRA